MKFYVLRHPITESNINKIAQGWSDSPLIPKSIKVAEAHGKFLKDKNITRIYTSDLGRCIQTSKIINKFLDVQIKRKRELREQNLGKYNGIHIDEIKKEFDENDYDAKPPKGESFKEMKTRVLSFIKNLRDNDNVLIVTHTGCVQSILSEALNEDLNSENCKTKEETICLFELENEKITPKEKY